MKKKRLFILVIAVTVAISMFTGCFNNELSSTDVNTEKNPGVITNGIFSITVPEDWPEKIYLEISEDTIKIYQMEAYVYFGGGWLCSIEMYEDDAYLELPQYEVLKSEDTSGITYVAQYPSDVQANVENEESMTEYFEMFSLLPEIVQTFKLVN